MWLGGQFGTPEQPEMIAAIAKLHDCRADHRLAWCRWDCSHISASSGVENVSTCPFERAQT